MFGDKTNVGGALMGSKMNSTTLNCLKDMEMENQRLTYQVTSLRAAYKKLRDQYQGLYSQSSTYYQESLENKEYKDQYDTLRKKCQEKEESLKHVTESKQQPSLEQGDAYRRQFPYLSYANGIPPNTEIHIKPVDSSKNLQPLKKRRRREKTDKKLLARKYKKYCTLYNEQKNENEEKEELESDGESAMEIHENRDQHHSR